MSVRLGQRKRVGWRRPSYGWPVLFLGALLAFSILIIPRPLEAEEQSPLKEESLDNGLTLLMWEDHRVPLVSLWCWYRVGSIHEPPGQTGMAHWLEHLTFRATENLPDWGLPLLIESRGGFWDAYTWHDGTGYLQVLPADELELGVSLEAERMHRCVFSTRAVRHERRAALSEMERERLHPMTLLRQELAATSYRAHPYGRPILGWSSDLEGATKEELEAFYRSNYGPQNAILTIVGDFNESDALSLVERHFGSLSRGEEAFDLRTAEPPQQGERRAVRPSPDQGTYVGIALHASNAADPDFIPLLLVDALLGGAKGVNLWDGSSQPPVGEKASRFYSSLVEGGHARWIRTELMPHRHPALYTLMAAASDGTSPAVLENLMREELARLEAGGFTDADLRLATKLQRSAMKLEAEGPTRFGHQLGLFAALGNPQIYLDLGARIEEATPADLRRVAAKYFGTEGMTVVWLVPSADRGHDGASTGDSNLNLAPRRRGALDLMLPEPRDDFDFSGAPVRFEEPDFTAREEKLGNGLSVIVGGEEGCSTVAVLITVSVGSSDDPPAEAGLSRMVAAMIPRGTVRKSRVELEKLLASRGARLTWECDSHRTMFLCEAETEELPRLVPLLFEILTEPAFAEGEWEEFLRETSDPRSVTGDMRETAAGSAVSLLFSPSEPGTSSVTREDLLRFYREMYAPERTSLVVTGSVDEEEVHSLISRYWGDWRAGAGGRRPEPGDRGAGTGKPLITTIPGSSRTALAWAARGPRRGTPDYEATEVLVAILGGNPLAGRLRDALMRREPLVSKLSMELLSRGKESIILLTMEGRPADIPPAIKVWRQERDGVAGEGVTPDELALGRAAVQGAYLRSFETPRSLAFLLGDISGAGLSPGHLEEGLNRRAWVTTADVREAARRYLAENRGRYVVVGPWAEREWDRSGVSW